MCESEDLLQCILFSAGREIRTLFVAETDGCDGDAVHHRRIFRGENLIVTGFAESISEIDFRKIRAVCIGKQTGEAARALGMQIWIADKATQEALTKELEEAAGGKPPIKE